MNDDPIIAQIIFTVVIASSIYGAWLKIIKPFLFPKNKERETISRSSRNQSQLIGRRYKK